jgi:protocatechuate 3,4-dioxygenase, alpha subunit
MEPKTFKRPPPHTAQAQNFGPTPSQTVGPFFAYGLVPAQYGYPFSQPFGAQLAQAHAAGLRIRVEGQVLDGDGVPITDALVEITQLDGQGRFPQSRQESQALGFTGFGRCGTGTLGEGRFAFDTVKPAAPDASQAPHINLLITMRGQLVHAITRLYFADEAAANATDAVLVAVPADRRATLIAHSPEPGLWRMSVRMQGAGETVFFDV